MASYRNENRPDSGDLLSWIITIVLLVSPVWPIGLILLLRKLTGGSRRRASRHPYDIQREVTNIIFKIFSAQVPYPDIV